MSAEVLKEFLVSLGFKLDEAALKKWDSALGRATKDVVSFAAAVTTSATAVTAAVGKIADEMEKLYFASRRTQSSVENIQALGYAASQMGGTVEGARSSLEGLARAMRNNPGIAGFLRGQLGINPSQAGTQIFDQLAERFQRMPYYLARAYSEMLGIDESTLQAMIQGLGEFQDDYHRIAGMSAIDANTAAKASRDFMVALRKLGGAFQVLSQTIMTRMQPVAKFFVNISERTIELLIQLDKYTNGWSTTIGTTLVGALTGALVAWKLLNIGFMASPLGLAITLVLGLAAAIALLYDDYKSWEEGGKSLIDWENWQKEIKLAGAWIEWVGEKIDWLGKKVKWLNELLGGDNAKAAANPDAVANAANPMGLGGIGQGYKALSDATRWLGKKMGIGGDDTSKGPSGASAGGTANGGSGVADRVMSFFESMGWTKAQAAGLASNLQHESGFDPNAKGDGGRALGIAQWHPDRQAAFKDFSGKDIRNSSLEEQLAFVHHELTEGNERRAGDALRGTQTAAEAGASVSSQYERPADRFGEMAKRAGTANDLFNRSTLGGTQLASAGNSEAAGSGVTLNQTNNVNVSGVSPDQVAKNVGTEIDQANNSALRDLKGAVR